MSNRATNKARDFAAVGKNHDLEHVRADEGFGVKDSVASRARLEREYTRKTLVGPVSGSLPFGARAADANSCVPRTAEKFHLQNPVASMEDISNNGEREAFVLP